MLIRKLWRSGLLVSHISCGFILLVATGALANPHTRVVRNAMRWWLGRVVRILNIEISVPYPLPHERNGAVLLVANHVSWVDIPLVGGMTPVSFLAKAEVARWPVVGTLARSVGTLFIKRGAGDTAKVAMTMADVLRNSRSVLFFPEGTSTDGTKMRKLHTRLFRVCDHTQASVHPLVIHYRAEGDDNPVPFIGDDEFASHLWRMLGHKRLFATVVVLPPVILDPACVHEQVAQIERCMASTLAQLVDAGSNDMSANLSANLSGAPTVTARAI